MKSMTNWPEEHCVYLSDPTLKWDQLEEEYSGLGLRVWVCGMVRFMARVRVMVRFMVRVMLMGRVSIGLWPGKAFDYKVRFVYLVWVMVIVRHNNTQNTNPVHHPNPHNSVVEHRP